ncbi:MAG TPA: MFS transporter [Fimbriimonadaceae bacterium]
MAKYFRPERLKPSTTQLVGFYTFIMMALYNLAAVGLIAVPVQFILKDQLHLTAVQNSTFGFLTDSPFFIGFAFGFLRDRWRPLGKGDRGYFFAVPILMAIVYVWMAFAPHTYGVMLAGMFVISIFSAVLGAAAQGLLAAIAKDFGMMGRLSAIALITVRGSVIYSTYFGSKIDERFGHQVPFLASGVVCLAVMAMAFWRPKSIFRSGDEVFVSVIPENVGESVRRLLRHKAIYLPAIVLFLFEFAPGWGTPLFYFLTNHIHLSESAFGVSQAWLRFGNVAGAVIYPILCTKFRFKPLLNWGTVLAVIGGPAFLLIHGPPDANVVSFLAGLSCGVALGSYYDLLVRCCPKELEGVAYMLTIGAFTFAGDASDIFGSWLYDQGGFALALGISTAFTALIFIPIAMLPRNIVNPHEGERMVDPDPPQLEAEAV